MAFSDATSFTHSYPWARASNPFEQPLSSAEQDRCNSNVQFINEALAKILLDGVRPTADAHVHSAGRLACPFKRVANAARDEMERRVAFHLDGWAGMVRQDEDRNDKVDCRPTSLFQSMSAQAHDGG